MKRIIKLRQNIPFSQIIKLSSLKSKHLTRLGINDPAVTKTLMHWNSVLSVDVPSLSLEQFCSKFRAASKPKKEFIRFCEVQTKAAL